MKLVMPDYFHDFKCLAGKCSHSCCIGWEIDIDEDTAGYYLSVDGSMGEKLKKSIFCADDGTYSFILGKDERCPFLNSAGLCELILELGDESLCQICRDHPRFRNYFSDRTEIGLGLCCESAAELILRKTESVNFISLTQECDDEVDADLDEQILLDFRNALIDAAQDRSLNVLQRANIIDSISETPITVTAAELSKFMLRLERLDDNWTNELKLIENFSESSAPAVFASETWQSAFEQLLVYLLFRHVQLDHFEKFAVTMFRLIVTILSAHYINGDEPDINTFINICRMWSSEIEYSDENTALILNFIQDKH